MNEAMNRRMQLLIYENQVMKAQLRQYQTKQRKIQRLCCAAIYRDDYLSEVAVAGIERGDVTGNIEVKSDPEDDDRENSVSYDAARDLETD